MEAMNIPEEEHLNSSLPGSPTSGLSICHISVLNPSRHTRIFFKLALSQQAFGYRVSIIGQDEAPHPYEYQQVNIIPLPPFGRLSWKRFLALPIWLIRRIRKHPAQIYWLHSPELMGLGWLLKMRGKKVVYDAHEDYFKTIYYAKHYPQYFRIPLAYLVRFLEKRWVRSLDAVVYAETCYDNMLNIPQEKAFVLRNTFTSRAIQTSKSSAFSVPADKYLLYTGTLAKEWGIFRTLELWKRLNRDAPLPLVIAGFTHSHALLKEIEAFVDESGLKSLFRLVGGNTYVPYHHIIELIQNCYFGTALYELSPVIRGKIPTKFFEFMAFGKALIYTRDPSWVSFDKEHQLGIAWEPGMETREIWDRVQNWKVSHSPDSYSWEKEENVLYELLKKLS